jgi:hypothetical protein
MFLNYRLLFIDKIIYACMSLPAVGDRCFYDLRLGKFGMYFKFYGFDGSNSR